MTWPAQYVSCLCRIYYNSCFSWDNFWRYWISSPI